MVEDRASDAIDPAGAGKGDEDSVLDGLSVRVGRNAFAEKLFEGILRIGVVYLRHRLNKPSLSV